MENVNETCQSIIDALGRIEEQQQEFYVQAMAMMEIIKQNTSKKK